MFLTLSLLVWCASQVCAHVNDTITWRIHRDALHALEDKFSGKEKLHLVQPGRKNRLEGAFDQHPLSTSISSLYLYILSLSLYLAPMAPPLRSPTRLLLEGTLAKTNRRGQEQKYYFHLLSDRLIYSSDLSLTNAARTGASYKVFETTRTRIRTLSVTTTHTCKHTHVGIHMCAYLQRYMYVFILP